MCSYWFLTRLYTGVRKQVFYFMDQDFVSSMATPISMIVSSFRSCMLYNMIFQQHPPVPTRPAPSLSPSSSPSSSPSPTKKPFTVLQWNILADGLAFDGFVFTMKETIETTGGLQVKIQDYISEILRAKRMGDATQLAALGQTYNTESARIDAMEILSWEKRFARMTKVLRQHSPDIMTFQEMDRLRDVMEEFGEEYSCALPGVDVTSYHPAPEYDLEPSRYLPTLAKRGLAFAPKAKSIARKYSLRRVGKDSVEASRVDNDGVAIFWKKSRFQVEHISFMMYPKAFDNTERSQAVVRVMLKDRYNVGERVVVSTTHLPSGVSNESNRLQILRGNTPDCKKKGVIPTPEQIEAKDKSHIITAHTEKQDGNDDTIVTSAVTATECTHNGVLQFVTEFTGRPHYTNVFALDANSNPTTPVHKDSDNQNEPNVWHVLNENLSGMSSVWGGIIDMNTGKASKNLEFGPILASVNKMRGPLTEQLQKIGHACELIDNVYSDGPMEHIGNIPRYENKLDARLHLIPSTSMPSDHYPVIVRIMPKVKALSEGCS